MNRKAPRRVAKVVAATALALSLSACISVFPESEPATLYRFGQADVGVPKGPKGAVFSVL